MDSKSGDINQPRSTLNSSSLHRIVKGRSTRRDNRIQSPRISTAVLTTIRASGGVEVEVDASRLPPPSCGLVIHIIGLAAMRRSPVAGKPPIAVLCVAAKSSYCRCFVMPMEPSYFAQEVGQGRSAFTLVGACKLCAHFECVSACHLPILSIADSECDAKLQG